MAEEEQVGCGRPTGAVVSETQIEEKNEKNQPQGEVKIMTSVMVSQKAPDFAAPAFDGGKIRTVKLSEYLGKWVVLCFYPGDFTFV